MSHELLENTGRHRSVAATEYESLRVIDITDPVDAVAQILSLPSGSVALLELGNTADGRAFSVIGELSANGSVSCAVWVGGALIPDQVTLAFQCGADAVVLTNDSWLARGEAAWLATLEPAVSLGYRQSVWSAVGDIRQQRSSSV